MFHIVERMVSIKPSSCPLKCLATSNSFKRRSSLASTSRRSVRILDAFVMDPSLIFDYGLAMGDNLE